MAEQRANAAKRKQKNVADLLKEAGIKIIGRATADQDDQVLFLPLVMHVPCGDPQEISMLVEEAGESQRVAVRGELIGLSTANTWVAEADGLSMQNGDSPSNIGHGDKLLMVPFSEYEGDIHAGMIVLAKLRYKNGSMKCTLKEYTGKRLKANNPTFKGVDFGPDIKEATVWAVCAAVLPKVLI